MNFIVKPRALCSQPLYHKFTKLKHTDYSHLMMCVKSSRNTCQIVVTQRWGRLFRRRHFPSATRNLRETFSCIRIHPAHSGLIPLFKANHCCGISDIFTELRMVLIRTTYVKFIIILFQYCSSIQATICFHLLFPKCQPIGLNLFKSANQHFVVTIYT